ncbi:DUF5320 domain-containing protein [Desulfobacula sp.]|uniref:DUF5320 domain-containing protein n=1 Tax=Desulfobacula sp. TaxID=2593537 RepID=UPI0025BE1ADC|nr:DUF5320 domain-containing protein [Desulfobacula sp.]MBC2704426.1 DUF5320 domain-containing protein [Desulfobacula sp.]
MPGFNQRGPMNEGAMTGRGRGNCTGAVDPDQGFTGRNDRGYGMGMGRQRGRRGCQTPGFGKGYGQTESVNQNTLQNSVDMLKAELAAVKKKLQDLSESGK